jgi:uncharacterized membrane protein
MRSYKKILLSLVTALALGLSGCGGGGGGSSPPAAGDGDILPEEPGVLFTKVILPGLPQGGASYALALNDQPGPLVAGLAVDSQRVVKGVAWTVAGDSATTPLPLQPLGNDSSRATAAYGVNLQGMTVGESETATGTAAVFWAAGSDQPAPLDLTGMAGSRSVALGINGSGQIVGEAEKAENVFVPVLWNHSAVALRELPLASFGSGAANFISDFGWIAGEADGRPVFWTVDAGGTPSGPTPLPLLTGQTRGTALSVDNAGRIVGESEADDGVVHAVLWEKSAVGDSFVISRSLGAAASAQAINDGTRIAGYTSAGAASLAAIWDTRTTEESRFSLVLAGGLFSQAYGLNQAGMVVGTENHQAFVALPED